MSPRRIVLVAICAALATTGSACSSDDTKGATGATSTTTTTSPTGSSTTVAAAQTTGVPTTLAAAPPVDDSEFGRRIAALNQSLSAAGTDTCKIAGNTTGALPSSSTVAQARQVVDLLSRLFNALADSLPAASAADATALRATSTGVITEATTAGFDPKIVLDGTKFKMYQNEPFGTAMKNIAKKCPQVR